MTRNAGVELKITEAEFLNERIEQFKLSAGEFRSDELAIEIGDIFNNVEPIILDKFKSSLQTSIKIPKIDENGFAINEFGDYGTTHTYPKPIYLIQYLSRMYTIIL